MTINAKKPSGKAEKELKMAKNPILGDFKQYKRSKEADRGRKQFSAKLLQMTMSLHFLGKASQQLVTLRLSVMEFLNWTGIVNGDSER